MALVLTPSLLDTRWKYTNLSTSDLCQDVMQILNWVLHWHGSNMTLWSQSFFFTSGQSSMAFFCLCHAPNFPTIELIWSGFFLGPILRWLMTFFLAEKQTQWKKKTTFETQRKYISSKNTFPIEEREKKLDRKRGMQKPWRITAWMFFSLPLF